MPKDPPPLCREYITAKACAQEALKAVSSLKLILLNSDTPQVSILARDALARAMMMERRARDRWLTVATKYAIQIDFLSMGPEELGVGYALADAGDRNADDCKEELERLGGVRGKTHRGH